MADTRLSSVEAVSENECLTKELQRKQTSVQGKLSNSDVSGHDLESVS